MTLDKYQYYQMAVQSPDIDAIFLDRVYRELRHRSAKTLREDFCAAFALCCQWASLSEQHVAYGIDLDPEPLEYGREHYLAELEDSVQKRVHALQTDVLNPELPLADIIAALNFSYFSFKDRPTLKTYFENCYRTLAADGILVLDCFGGPACMEPNEHETEYDDFSYFWDQDSYDPLTNEAKFAIHFKPRGQKKAKDVFTYDWRLWSLSELSDLMKECGFKSIHFYWEGTDDQGEGDGEFSKVEAGEICESWVAYIIGEK
jgi:SAM-dependent methyltransferase